MKREPVLVILAAGMGSRYGGLKQIDAVGDNGECIIDFSLYDAYRAGFRKAVLIIRREHESAFDQALVSQVRKKMEVRYAFQDLQDLPEGFAVPAGRVKPWGTTQALLCTEKIVDGPFMIINADDFYGAESYQKMYDYLAGLEGDQPAMIGFRMANTLTANGTVTRGLCEVKDGYLKKIREIQEIRPKGSASEYRDGDAWTALPEDALCSMNYWGFTPAIYPLMRKRFLVFLANQAQQNPLKAEHVIPSAIGELLEDREVSVKVMATDFRWFGVTYQADKPLVKERIAGYKAAGLYPHDLWK